MSAVRSLQELMRPIAAFDASTPVTAIADAFLDPKHEYVLSLAIVENNQPVGTISRHQLNQIFLKRFGRELYGDKPAREFMDTEPLIVEISSGLGEAASYITRNMRMPLSVDFIIVREGVYLGLGAVLELLGAVEGQLRSTAANLSKTLNQLRQSQSQLIQSEKMAALGQMVAGVAHEINTPLGYIRNNVEMLHEFCLAPLQLVPRYESLLQELLDPQSNFEELMKRIETLHQDRTQLLPDTLEEDLSSLFQDTCFGMDQVSELVMGLKNFSRMDQASVDDVDLNQCLENSLLIARNVLKYGIELIRRHEVLPPVRCVPSQINQVLLNLLTNAAQAMPHGGKILLKSWSDDLFVYFSIQDTGCGIAPEHLERIFDPFFTTKPVGTGTGLGLSISFNIMKQHGGKIQVASVVGKGTRFVLTLPRQQQQAVA